MVGICHASYSKASPTFVDCLRRKNAPRYMPSCPRWPNSFLTESFVVMSVVFFFFHDTPPLFRLPGNVRGLSRVRPLVQTNRGGNRGNRLGISRGYRGDRSHRVSGRPRTANLFCWGLSKGTAAITPPAYHFRRLPMLVFLESGLLHYMSPFFLRYCTP